MGDIRFCLCGCGEIVTNKRHKFIKGHLDNLKNKMSPLYSCGCGEHVSFDRWKLVWNKYISGHYNKNRPEIHNKKISVALKISLVGEGNPFYGKHHTEETKIKLAILY